MFNVLSNFWFAVTPIGGHLSCVVRKFENVWSNRSLLWSTFGAYLRAIFISITPINSTRHDLLNTFRFHLPLVGAFADVHWQQLWRISIQNPFEWLDPVLLFFSRLVREAEVGCEIGTCTQRRWLRWRARRGSVPEGRVSSRTTRSAWSRWEVHDQSNKGNIDQFPWI